jgi:hypothetical protein
VIRSGTLIGALGAPYGATVDERGLVHPERAGWTLDWWIGADDRWHIAAREAAVRQTRVANMPVLRTAMKVPGGDAVHTAYGTADVAVVEIANDSPAPFVAALVMRGVARADLDDGVAFLDGRPAVATTRAPARWAAATDGSTEATVTSGLATDAPFAPRADRGARLTIALLYPVAHRTVLRAVVATSPRGLPADAADPAACADAEAVARGWVAQLARGMRATVPDAALQHAVDAARADLLLAGQAWLPDPVVVEALEDWGFDTEAAAAWPRLPGRARRRLGKRTSRPADWDAVEHARASGSSAALLIALRAVLVRDTPDGIEVAGSLPRAWRGAPVDVRDAPTRAGPVSFSLRWHGERVALLWEAPEGVHLTAPGLDPTFAATTARGEVLLAADGGDA